MEKKSLYIRRLICTGAILCVFCVFVKIGIYFINSTFYFFFKVQILFWIKTF